MFSKAKIVTSLLTASLFVGGIGCGDAGSNNDQGASVTATGYFTDATGTTGETGKVVPLATDVSTINSGVFPLDGQTVITFLQVVNRLSSQFFRLDRIDCDYTVPGASISIPSDSFAIGAVIEPSPAAAPGVVADQLSSVVAGFEVVSPDLFAFLNVNRLSLPELPFRAVATCRGVGVTQGGDTLETNSLNYFLQFGEVSECCTGQTTETPGSSAGGFQQGSGSGGTLNTFSNDGGAATGAADSTEDTTTEDGGDTE